MCISTRKRVVKWNAHKNSKRLDSLTVKKTLKPLFHFLFEFSNHKFSVQKLATRLLTVSCTESDCYC